MMRKLLSGVFGLVLARLACGAPAPLYENWGSHIWPPQPPPSIDAITFVNHGQLILNYTNPLVWNPPAITIDPYSTRNTLNYYNLFGALLSCNTGFIFDNDDSQTERHRWASVFVNEGAIRCGTYELTNLFSPWQGGYNGSRLRICAAGITNAGSISMGFESHCELLGGDVDLSRGTISSQKTNVVAVPTSFFWTGWQVHDRFFEGYWGAGTNFSGTVLSANPVWTPEHEITDRSYHINPYHRFSLANPLIYVDDVFDSSLSNRYTSVVLLSNPDTNLAVNVYFPSYAYGYSNVVVSIAPAIVVEWIAATIDEWGQPVTNYVYLYDFMMNGASGLFPTGYAGDQNDFTRLTYVPYNFMDLTGNWFNGIWNWWPRSTPFETTNKLDFGLPATPSATLPSNAAIVPSGSTYSAYECLLEPMTRLRTDVVGQDVTNVPGSIEITATNLLELSRSEISSLNYLMLKATNQFGGNTGARISSPFADLCLASHTGTLAISNLLKPAIVGPEGRIDLYASHWRDVAQSITNYGHVLFVDSRLSALTPARVQSLNLTSRSPSGQDNVVISDVLNVTRNMCLDCRALTLTTNTAGAFTPVGAINILDPNIVWSTSLPRLQCLTNDGFIRASNSMFFGGSRTSPTSAPVMDRPYGHFINRGGVTNYDSVIWCTNFQNYGTFIALNGSLSLQKALSATLADGGAFLATAPAGAISIESDNLYASNHVLIAGGALTLAVTNYLDDGSYLTATGDYVTNKNTWKVGNGIHLLVRPWQSSLLGTTIVDVNDSHATQMNRWAAADLGPTLEGFQNNAALGRLVLDGRHPDSLFSFAPVRGTNALYVDRLELLNCAATNLDSANNLLSVQIKPNMKIYYAQAVTVVGTNTVSIAEKLNGLNAGRFCWVSNYAGTFSYTNIVYPNGTTNRVNMALALSCTLDSNTNWIANCIDSAPVPPEWFVQTTNPPVVQHVTEVVIDPPPVVPVDPLAGTRLGFPPSTAKSGVLSNAFVVSQGLYSGLFADTNGVALASSGYFTASTTARGTYSGKLLLAGRSYPFSGRFDLEGAATNVVRLSASVSLTLRLNLDITSGTQIRGSITDGYWWADLTADRLVFKKSGNPAAAVRYTMALPADPESEGGPSGYGVATLKVDSGGRIALAGTLADGTAFSQSSAMSLQGFWPLYASLYQGRGSVISWLKLAPYTANDLSGRLIWTKAAAPAARYFPLGFTNVVDVLGSAYTAPLRGQRVLDSNPAGQFFVRFQDGGLSAPFLNTCTVNFNNRVASSPWQKLTLSFSTASGIFRGRTQNPATGKFFSFQGVVLQNANLNCGAGFFRGPVASGEVYLKPAQ